MSKSFGFGSMDALPQAGHRVVLYGTGGIGKTTLSAAAPGPVGIVDLDDSLPSLASSLNGYPIKPMIGVESWTDLMDALNPSSWDGVHTVVLDSVTRAEEMAVAHTLATVRGDKDSTVRNVEGYGYGKGYQYVYDTFLPILNFLDMHVRDGRNVILIAHDCTTTVPNPTGDDWIRYEPRLQAPSSGKGSIRLRLKEWADHLLFYGYDVNVSKSGIGQGSGSRTIYLSELPSHIAKSRSLASMKPTWPVNNNAAEFWIKLFGVQPVAPTRKPPSTK